jgi:hypothetical protein
MDVILDRYRKHGPGQMRTTAGMGLRLPAGADRTSVAGSRLARSSLALANGSAQQVRVAPLARPGLAKSWGQMTASTPIHAVARTTNRGSQRLPRGRSAANRACVASTTPMEVGSWMSLIDR